jgi:hypothetical protein
MCFPVKKNLVWTFLKWIPGLSKEVWMFHRKDGWKSD